MSDIKEESGLTENFKIICLGTEDGTTYYVASDSELTEKNIKQAQAPEPQQ